MKRELKNKWLITASLLLVIIISSACSKDESVTEPPKPPTTNELKGAYLGQTAPGNTPLKFSPSSNFSTVPTSWWWHGSPAFTPDGNLMLFTKYMANHSGTEIWMTEVVDGKWTIPLKAPFIQGKANNPVFISKDTLMYVGIVMNGTALVQSDIYRIVRTNNSWGAPVKINIPFPANHKFGWWDFTVSKNKSIYLPIEVGNSPADIYVSKFVNGQYQTPELVSSINSAQNDDPTYIDPEEKFFIISSNRTGGQGLHDLYISYKNADGTWNTPKNLGTAINGYADESFGIISPDGKYFFFNSIKPQNGDSEFCAYWVDAKVLDALK